jgi:hypothetical protein
VVPVTGDTLQETANDLSIGLKESPFLDFISELSEEE